MEATMKSLKLPQIDSIEELAQFWDTHDLTEFAEELEEVTEPVFERKPETTIPLHLHPQELEAVKRAAQARGVAEAVLLREWVLEKLHASV
jgi:predicted DNA binding CopG/RHH family protein